MSGLGVDGALAIQTEKTQRYGDAVGGIAEVTMADGAALCAGMPERHYNAVRLVEMHDPSVVAYVRIELWRFAMELSALEKWRGKVSRGDGEHDKPRLLADIAIAEALEPARYGQANSWKLKADWLGVSRTQWFEVWSARYDDVFMRLTAWSGFGVNYLKNKCKKNSDDGGLTNPE